MSTKKWLVKDSSVEDGVKWWFLYEFPGDPKEIDDHILEYSRWSLVHINVLKFKKRYSSEEELELEVMVKYGDSAEFVELPKPTPFTEL